MGAVRTRRETGKLYLDFMYQGIRCRESTSLINTPQNTSKLTSILNQIEAKITLGIFDYEEHFPSSKNLARIKSSVEKASSERTLFQSKTQESSYPAFNKFTNQWFDEMKVQWRQSHIRNMRSVLDSSHLPYFKDTPIDQITKSDILAFRSELAGKPGRTASGVIQPKTVNAHMTLLKGILAEASDRLDLQTPYRNIKPLKVQKKHVEPFSLENVNLILEKVRADYRAYYAVRFYSGMRTGEIDGLKWKHVDFDRKQILIRETLVNGRTEYTKTDGSQREIPMLGPVFNALKSQQLATGKVSKYVFCNREGLPLDHCNVTKRVWYPLLQHLKLTKRRPYQTRHTTATLLLASGENPEWVARVLGHSSTEMLFKVYSRYIPNLTRQDGSAFERLVNQ